MPQRRRRRKKDQYYFETATDICNTLLESADRLKEQIMAEKPFSIFKSTGKPAKRGRAGLPKMELNFVGPICSEEAVEITFEYFTNDPYGELIKMVSKRTAKIAWETLPSLLENSPEINKHDIEMKRFPVIVIPGKNVSNACARIRRNFIGYDKTLHLDVQDIYLIQDIKWGNPYITINNINFYRSNLVADISIAWPLDFTSFKLASVKRKRKRRKT